jgi:hypothetical protein
LAADDVI